MKFLSWLGPLIQLILRVWDSVVKLKEKKEDEKLIEEIEAGRLDAARKKFNDEVLEESSKKRGD